MLKYPMNLIFIYGPPASGKLTVAKELAELTGYPVFHNHLTFDLVHEVFGDHVPWKLIDQIRFDVLKEASLSNIPGLIMTYVYAHQVDDDFVKTLRDTVEANDCKIYFVQLSCDQKELKNRVIQESRRQFKKINDPEKLDKLLTEYDLTTPIPFVKSLTIDNTNLDPKTVAKQIQSFAHLVEI